jgi:hypothetical protein
LKIIDAITRIDNLKHNTYTKGEKIAWLSRVDGSIKRLVIDTHEGADKEKAITEYMRANIAAHEEAVVEYMKVHEVSREEAEKNVEFREIKYKEAKEHIEATRNDIFFTGYNEDTDPQTELLVPAPWDELYIHWLEAQIDYHNGEYTKYNNSAARYNELLQEYASHYTREHKPLVVRPGFF